VTIKFLDLHAQYLTIKADIDAAIEGVIRETAFVGGARITRFEERFAAYQQTAHCVGVANGTDAIEIALEALELPRGAEVIVPANSFIASSESVTRSGLRVVFADVDPATYTLDPADVERRLTPKTRAIMAVHLYGHPCDMDALGALARKHDLRIVEDSAQAHGAEYRGRRVGGLGHVSTFSFYPGKNLGAYGDGGAICTDDAALARRCRMIANHGRVDKYNHEFEGRNSRLDGLQAAILDVKLDSLDGWVTKRNELARAYLAALRGIEGLTLPVLASHVRHAFHLFVVRSPRRDALAAHLNAAGIQTGIHYPIALPKLAAYGYLGQAKENMSANRFDGELLSLPMGEHLSLADIERVSTVIQEWHRASR
jgi:dTDP-4-amino-4,6-dideoxygalactose transaminase